MVYPNPHQPPLKVRENRHLGDIYNPCLIDPRSDIIHVPGVKHKSQDATSGHPTGKEDHMETASRVTEEDPRSKVPKAGLKTQPDQAGADQCTMGKVMASIVSPSLDMESPMITTLVNSSNRGIHNNRDNCPEDTREHSRARLELDTINPVRLHGERMITPPPQAEAREVMNAARQGTTGTIPRAVDSVHWPGIQKDSARKWAAGTSCDKCTPTSRQPS